MDTVGLGLRLLRWRFPTVAAVLVVAAFCLAPQRTAHYIVTRAMKQAEQRVAPLQRSLMQSIDKQQRLIDQRARHADGSRKSGAAPSRHKHRDS